MTKSKPFLPRRLSCLVISALLLAGLACSPKAAVEPTAPKTPLDAQSETKAQGVREEAEKKEAEVSSIYSPETLALIQAYHRGEANLSEKAHAIIDAKTQSKDAALALCLLAQLAFEDEALDLARLYAQRATVTDPELDDGQMLLGRIATAQTRYRDALKHYENAAKLAPQKATANIAAAALLLNFLDSARAVDKAQAAYEIEAENCQAIAILADAHMAQKNYQKALNYYEDFQERANCQNSEKLLQNLAKIYEVQIQNPDKACQTYQKLLEISPDNANYQASRDYQCQQK